MKKTMLKSGLLASALFALILLASCLASIDGGITKGRYVATSPYMVITVRPDGKTIHINLTATAASLDVEGATQATVNTNNWEQITAVKDTVIIKGDITAIQCQEPNRLISLDVSGLPNLKTLVCHKTELTSLNVRGLSKLETLTCSENILEELDLSGVTALKNLSCENNGLKRLTVKQAKNLTTLNCSGNHSLHELDVRTLTKLTKLNCAGDGLRELSVHGLSELEKLECQRNKLTALELSNLPVLEELNCSENDFNSFTLSDLPALKKFTCNRNKDLTELGLLNLEALVNLDCYQNRLNSLSISECPALKAVNLCKNNLKTNVLNTLLAQLREVSSHDGKVIVYSEDGSEHNDTDFDLQTAKKNGWKLYKIKNGMEILL